MEHGLMFWVFLIGGIMLIFGNPKRFAELGRGMGSFLREFKAAQREGQETLAGEAKPAVVVQAPAAQEAPHLAAPAQPAPSQNAPEQPKAPQ